MSLTVRMNSMLIIQDTKINSTYIIIPLAKTTKYQSSYRLKVGKNMERGARVASRFRSQIKVDLNELNTKYFA